MGGVKWGFHGEVYVYLRWAEPEGSGGRRFPREFVSGRTLRHNSSKSGSVRTRGKANTHTVVSQHTPGPPTHTTAHNRRGTNPSPFENRGRKNPFGGHLQAELSGREKKVTMEIRDSYPAAPKTPPPPPPPRERA